MISVRHIGLTVQDLELCVSFYELLGFSIEKKMFESGKCIDNFSSLEGVSVTSAKLRDENNSSVMLELLQYHSHTSGNDIGQNSRRPICDIGYSHFAISVDNLDDLYRKLSLLGTEFNCPPQTSPDGNVKITFCRDPEGNLIELVEDLNV